MASSKLGFIQALAGGMEGIAQAKQNRERQDQQSFSNAFNMFREQNQNERFEQNRADQQAQRDISNTRADAALQLQRDKLKASQEASDAKRKNDLLNARLKQSDSFLGDQIRGNKAHVIALKTEIERLTDSDENAGGMLTHVRDRLSEIKGLDLNNLNTPKALELLKKNKLDVKSLTDEANAKVFELREQVKARNLSIAEIELNKTQLSRLIASGQDFGGDFGKGLEVLKSMGLHKSLTKKEPVPTKVNKLLEKEIQNQNNEITNKAKGKQDDAVEAEKKATSQEKAERQLSSNRVKEKRLAAELKNAPKDHSVKSRGVRNILREDLKKVRSEISKAQSVSGGISSITSSIGEGMAKIIDSTSGSSDLKKLEKHIATSVLYRSRPDSKIAKSIDSDIDKLANKLGLSDEQMSFLHKRGEIISKRGDVGIKDVAEAFRVEDITQQIKGMELSEAKDLDNKWRKALDDLGGDSKENKIKALEEVGILRPKSEAGRDKIIKALETKLAPLRFGEVFNAAKSAVKKEADTPGLDERSKSGLKEAFRSSSRPLKAPSGGFSNDFGAKLFKKEESPKKKVETIVNKRKASPLDIEVLENEFVKIKQSATYDVSKAIAAYTDVEERKLNNGIADLKSLMNVGKLSPSEMKRKIALLEAATQKKIAKEKKNLERLAPNKAKK